MREGSAARQEFLFAMNASRRVQLFPCARFRRSACPEPILGRNEHVEITTSRDPHASASLQGKGRGRPEQPHSRRPAAFKERGETRRYKRTRGRDHVAINSCLLPGKLSQFADAFSVQSNGVVLGRHAWGLLLNSRHFPVYIPHTFLPCDLLQIPYFCS